VAGHTLLVSRISMAKIYQPHITEKESEAERNGKFSQVAWLERDLAWI
jgi:hypothetical protein